MSVPISRLREFHDHKLVKEFRNEKSGLHGYIAIHNDNLGTPVGGTRLYSYSNPTSAVRDVLRLSYAMTYKCAISGVKHGGGKAVIIHKPENTSKKLLKDFAQEINNLQGAFYTGEDVGITEANVQYMLKYSPYFIGKTGQAGDPSPYAALSTFLTMKTAAKIAFGNNGLKGKTVAVKGVGKVGSALVDMLIKEGAKVIIADIESKAIKNILDKHKSVKETDHITVHKLKVDVFAPCALGNEINKRNMKSIKASVICGGANNQLKSPEVGDRLYRQGILYVPDYIANAGGLINVVDELEDGGYSRKRVVNRIENLTNTLKKVIYTSTKSKTATNRVADDIAEQLFNHK